ncbi:MAG: hypothetical protein AB1514_12650 [Pseudomonadota bacterium]
MTLRNDSEFSRGPLDLRNCPQQPASQGESDRDAARVRFMRRKKVARLRAMAVEHGWLSKETPLPEDAEMAALIQKPKPACAAFPARAGMNRPGDTCTAQDRPGHSLKRHLGKAP